MTTGPQEIELKFALTAQAAEALRQGVFEDAECETLVSIYYDTPALDLQQCDTTLRLRQTPKGWLQTVKAGGTGAIARFEDERPVAGEAIELALLQDGPLADLADDDLSPLFATHIARRTAVVRYGASEIELALDAGEVRAGTVTQPVLELELELKSGAVDDLFAEAHRLTQAPGMILSLTSKAERGYALAAGAGGAAAHFDAPKLNLAGPAVEGFQALAMACLHQLAANLARLAERPGLQAVHQARVALRRLRVTIGAFGDMVADADLASVKAELKRMSAVFAEARALDVFAAETLRPYARHEPGAGAFAAALLQVQTAAYADVVHAVGEPAFAAGLLQVAQWVTCGAWTTAPNHAAARERPLRRVAADLLRHRRKQMRKRGRKLDWRDPIARHKLRIQAKKMRYLIDAFGDADAGLKPLKRLQSELGDLNDIHTAPDTIAYALKHVAADAGFAAGSAVGERRAGVDHQVRRARRAFTQFAKS